MSLRQYIFGGGLACTRFFYFYPQLLLLLSWNGKPLRRKPPSSMRGCPLSRTRFYHAANVPDKLQVSIMSVVPIPLERTSRYSQHSPEVHFPQY